MAVGTNEHGCRGIDVAYAGDAPPACSAACVHDIDPIAPTGDRRLRAYTTCFVIEEQAYLELESAGEWDSLLGALASHAPRVDESGDIIAIMTGDRDQRFTAGLRTILFGTVRTESGEPALDS